MAASRPDVVPPCGSLAGRATSDLSVFTSWLDEHRVDGVVGEVGWPSSTAHAWEAVASPWLGDALRHGVGVYVWGAAEQWDAAYPLAVYRDAADGSFVSGQQSHLVEGTLAPASVGPGMAALRGVALSGPSFGASFDETSASYSSARPGVRGADYVYPSWRFLVRLAERGITSVRLAVMWERLQPRLFGPLAAGELAEVRRVLDSAAQLGITVVIDLHNFGRYVEGSTSGGSTVLRVGSKELPARALGDLWRRVAVAVGGSPALAAYGLMNEPHGLPGGARRWERTTQEVVRAVRAVDADTLILVPGYGWSSAAAWRQNHPVPWVDDSRIAYEAHQYFDHDRTGTYQRSIDEESALAAETPCR